MALSPARAAAFDILLRVEQQDAHASELLHSHRLEPLSVADRALATELVMGVLRWRARLDAALAAASQRSLEKLDAEVRTALRLAAYQLGFLERVPARAAVHESVELVKRARKRSAAPFANAVLRRLAAQAASLRPGASAAPADAAALAAHFAHPQWLVERWVDRFGADIAARICAFDQAVPPTFIRLRDAAAAGDLEREGIRLEPGTLLATARRVVAGDIIATQTFAAGRVAFQDEASQLVAALVGAGQRLLDCCAAPGGKTAALADRNPGARILAADIHPHRARLVEQQVRRRAGLENVRVLAADARNLPVGGEFDRVLADVPCSGTGTLARNPEIKWRLRRADLADLSARQQAILRGVLPRLARGGVLLYSTCSLEREENQAVVEAVLREAPEFELLDVRQELERLRAAGELICPNPESLADGPFLQTIPGVQPCDGFFAARLRRR